MVKIQAIGMGLLCVLIISCINSPNVQNSKAIFPRPTTKNMSRGVKASNTNPENTGDPDTLSSIENSSIEDASMENAQAATVLDSPTNPKLVESPLILNTNISIKDSSVKDSIKKFSIDTLIPDFIKLFGDMHPLEQELLPKLPHLSTNQLLEELEILENSLNTGENFYLIHPIMQIMLTQILVTTTEPVLAKQISKLLMKNSLSYQIRIAHLTSYEPIPINKYQEKINIKKTFNQLFYILYGLSLQSPDDRKQHLQNIENIVNNYYQEKKEKGRSFYWPQLQDIYEPSLFNNKIKDVFASTQPITLLALTQIIATDPDLSIKIQVLNIIEKANLNNTMMLIIPKILTQILISDTILSYPPILQKEIILTLKKWDISDPHIFKVVAQIAETSTTPEVKQVAIQFLKHNKLKINKDPLLSSMVYNILAKILLSNNATKATKQATSIALITMRPKDPQIAQKLTKAFNSNTDIFTQEIVISTLRYLPILNQDNSIHNMLIELAQNSISKRVRKLAIQTLKNHPPKDTTTQKKLITTLKHILLYDNSATVRSEVPNTLSQLNPQDPAVHDIFIQASYKEKDLNVQIEIILNATKLPFTTPINNHLIATILKPDSPLLKNQQKLENILKAIREIPSINEDIQMALSNIMLSHSSNRIRWIAINTLRETNIIPPTMYNKIIQALKDPYINVQQSAIIALEKIQPTNKQILQLLIKNLSNPIESSQILSAETLSHILEQNCNLISSFYQPLINNLQNHPSNTVKILLAETLKNCPSTDPAIHQSIVKVVQNEQDFTTKINIIKILQDSQITDTAVFSLLIKKLPFESHDIQRELLTVLENNINQVIKINDIDIMLLSEFLLTKNIHTSLQHKVISILEQFNTHTSMIVLSNLTLFTLSNKEANMQKQVLDILYKSKQLISKNLNIQYQLVQLLLNDKNWSIRKKTAWILGEIKPDNPNIHLKMAQAILLDTSPTVQLEIATALAKIQPSDTETLKALSTVLSDIKTSARSETIKKIVSQILEKTNLTIEQKIKKAWNQLKKNIL